MARHALRFASLTAVLLAAGCSVLPQPGPVAAEFDFGPPTASTAPAARLRSPLLVPDVTSPGWMDSGGIVYRLAYKDSASPRHYANSRWVTPPGTLYTARLRERVAAASSVGVVAPGDNVRYEAALRVDIVEFSQVFDSAETSRALVQVRGTIVRDHKLTAQRTFLVERKTTSNDAAGGAAALAAAADESIDAVVRWTAEVLGK